MKRGIAAVREVKVLDNKGNGPAEKRQDRGGAAERGQGSRFVRTGGSLLILLLAFGLRMVRLDGQSLWWDEMATAARAALPLDAMLDNLLTVRNHVPLYFLLIRLWSGLGNTGFSLRFFSVLWGVSSVAWIERLGRSVGGRRVGMVAALLLAVSPFHIWYSQEARMYTMVSLCALAGNWFLLRSLQRDSWVNWAGYGISMSAALYTHYLALWVLVAHYTFFALHFRSVRRIFVKWLVCSVAMVSLLGIWGAMILPGGGFARAPIGWIAPARWYEPVLTMLTFAAGPTIRLVQPLAYLSLAVCLAAVAACWVRARYRQLTLTAAFSGHVPRYQVGDVLAPKLLFYWLLVPLLLTWVISWDLPILQKRSIYMDRYLITTLPAFVMLVAWGLVLMSERGRGLAVAALAAVIVAAVLALCNLYYDPSYAREDWRAAMTYLDAERGPGDVLLLRPNHTLPLAYYGHEDEEKEPVAYQEVPFLFDEGEREAYLAQEMGARMAAIAQEWDRAWFMSSVENTDPHGFPHERNASLRRVGERDGVKAWLDARYVRLEEVFFTGICLTLYDLSPARGG
jgi:mannosyltransferase